ncbi:MAG: DNA-directed DNA polymerase II small subunit [Halobacteria archaeon]
MEDEIRKVVKLLSENGLNATKKSATAIAKFEEPKRLVEKIVETHGNSVVVTMDEVEESVSRTDGVSAVGAEEVNRGKAEGSVDAGSNGSPTGNTRVSNSPGNTSGQVTADSGAETVDNRPEERSVEEGDQQGDEETYNRGGESGRVSLSSGINISKDITGESTCTGEYDDFVGYFRDRYEKLSRILGSRLNHRTIESAVGRDVRESVVLIGMVNDVRSTNSNNVLVEIEDTTGTIRVLFSDDDLIQESRNLVHDEVIGVEGRLSDDGGILFADELYYPEVPPRRDYNTAEREVKAVMVSDVHVGSEAFVGEKWRNFTDWLSHQDDVEYLLVGGDLVEGVGIYPNQDEELTIVDIHDQYRACAEIFKDIPDDIEVIAISGNHDSVRLAEPQPALQDSFREPFDSNVRFVGNPAMVDIEGVNFLMYHGVSLNAFVEKLPGLEVESPDEIMSQILRKRHLAPMYGDIRLAPEEEDHMVLEEVPDVLHTGHVHTLGVDRYNSVTMVNVGAWQSQTAYQKAVNIEPDVGYAAVVELSTLDVEIRSF